MQTNNVIENDALGFEQRKQKMSEKKKWKKDSKKIWRWKKHLPENLRMKTVLGNQLNVLYGGKQQWQFRLSISWKLTDVCFLIERTCSLWGLSFFLNLYFCDSIPSSSQCQLKTHASSSMESPLNITCNISRTLDSKIGKWK